jgi:uncharacterized membrane protein SirB2
MLAVTALLASVLTTLTALSTLLAALPGLVLATLLLLTGLLLSTAALLSAATLLWVVLALLLVVLRIVLAWIVRHWTFSSHSEGFRPLPDPLVQCQARPFVPLAIDRTWNNRLKNKQNR